MRVKILQQPLPEGPRVEVGERIGVTVTPREGIWSKSELTLAGVEHAIRRRWPGLRPGDYLLVTVTRITSPEVPNA